MYNKIKLPIGKDNLIEGMIIDVKDKIDAGVHWDEAIQTERPVFLMLIKTTNVLPQY